MLLRIFAALAVLVSFTTGCSAQFYASGGAWLGPPRGWGYGAYGAPRYWAPAGYYGAAGYSYRGPAAYGAYAYTGPAAYGAYAYTGPAAYGAGCYAPAQFRAGCVGAYSAGCAGAGSYTAPAAATQPTSRVDVKSPYDADLDRIARTYKPTQTETPVAAVEVTVNGVKIQPQGGKIEIVIRTGPGQGGEPGPTPDVKSIEGIVTLLQEELVGKDKSKVNQELEALGNQLVSFIRSGNVTHVRDLRSSFKRVQTALSSMTSTPKTFAAVNAFIQGLLGKDDEPLTEALRQRLDNDVRALIARLKETQ